MVSVIIANYNHRSELARAVESILNQTYKDFELIIVNDDPRYMLNEYKRIDKRIRIWNYRRRVGKDAAVNMGISMANGKYIAFQDADDVSTLWRLRVSVDNIGSHDLIYGDKINVSQNGRMIYEESKLFTHNTLWNGSIGSYSGIIVRSEIAKKIKFDSIGYDSDRLWCAKLLDEIETEHVKLPFYYYYNYTSNFRIRQRDFPFRYYDAIRNRFRLYGLRRRSDKIVRRVLGDKRNNSRT